MKIVLFILIFLFPAVTKAQGLITTIAGNGYPHDTGDGGAATAAAICRSNCSSFDKNGNFYIAERFCNTIRKINSAGIISHFAGTGTAGYSGDGGPATSAKLNDPWGLAIDDSNNLFIAEISGSRIRKINVTTGIITTIAGNGYLVDSGDGGYATSSSIAYPFDICFDENQNLYVSNSCLVRKIDATTQIIHTVAGYGTSPGYSGDGGLATAAKLNTPYGICVDSNDNLYIADYGNSRIRKVNGTTGIINTIAGDGVAAFNGDSITAMSARLAAFDLNFDRLGNLYIADESNNRIRKINNNGYIFTTAGTGVAGYGGDGGAADSAKIYNPEGVVVDPCGNIYVNDNLNARIRKVTYPNNNKPTITITASTGNHLCYGRPVTFTATTSLGGSVPVYQWWVNGAVVGGSTPTYTYTPANGDSVQCMLTSNLYCVVNPKDTSNTLHMGVDTFTAPAVGLTGVSIAHVGTSVTVNAIITGTASGYVLHWKNCGVEFTTTTVPTVTYTKTLTIDSITATMVSTGRGCYDSVVSGVKRVADVTSIPGPAVNAPRMTCYPNPVHNELIVEAGAAMCGVVVCDLVGQVVFRGAECGARVTVPVGHLTAGMYFVKCSFGDGGVVVERFVKE